MGHAPRADSGHSPNVCGGNPGSHGFRACYRIPSRHTLGSMRISAIVASRHTPTASRAAQMQRSATSTVSGHGSAMTGLDHPIFGMAPPSPYGVASVRYGAYRFVVHYPYSYRSITHCAACDACDMRIYQGSRLRYRRLANRLQAAIWPDCVTRNHGKKRRALLNGSNLLQVSSA